MLLMFFGIPSTLLMPESSFIFSLLIFLLEKHKSSTVAHACNPSYLGSRDQEDCSWRSAQLVSLEKVSVTPISINMLGVLVHVCDPSYAGGLGKRTTVLGQSGAKM
jgi:hypothetical protein